MFLLLNHRLRITNIFKVIFDAEFEFSILKYPLRLISHPIYEHLEISVNLEFYRSVTFDLWPLITRYLYDYYIWIEAQVTSEHYNYSILAFQTENNCQSTRAMLLIFLNWAQWKKPMFHFWNMKFKLNFQHCMVNNETFGLCTGFVGSCSVKSNKNFHDFV